MLEFTRRAGGLTLSFRGEPGARYRLQFRRTLDAEEPWADYGAGGAAWIADANRAGVLQFRPPIEGNEGYYRAEPHE